MEDLTGSCECGLFLFHVNKDQNNNASERHQRKRLTRENSKIVIGCYFKSNPTQRRYRERMVEIWRGYAKFNTSQRFVGQARSILKKGWWSDIEILEICGQVNREKPTH